MTEKFMAVPQDEMFEIVEKMDSLSNFVEEVMADHFMEDPADKIRLALLAEYYSGCHRIKEMVLDKLLKGATIDLKGQEIPENSVPIPDSDYLLLNNLLVGMLHLQIELLDKNVSLSIH